MNTFESAPVRINPALPLIDREFDPNAQEFTEWDIDSPEVVEAEFDPDAAH
jgi:hypothetical protein